MLNVVLLSVAVLSFTSRYVRERGGKNARTVSIVTLGIALKMTLSIMALSARYCYAECRYA